MEPPATKSPPRREPRRPGALPRQGPYRGVHRRGRVGVSRKAKSHASQVALPNAHAAPTCTSPCTRVPPPLHMAFLPPKRLSSDLT